MGSELQKKHQNAINLINGMTKHAVLPPDEHEQYEYMRHKREALEATEDSMKLARISEALVVHEIGKLAAGVRLQIMHVPEDDMLNSADATILLPIKNEEGKDMILPITVDVGYGKETVRSKACNIKWDLAHGGGHVYYPQAQGAVPIFVIGFSFQNLQMLAKVQETALSQSVPQSARTSAEKVLEVMRAILWHQIELQLEAMCGQGKTDGNEALLPRLEKAKITLLPVFRESLRIRTRASEDEDLRWLFACHAYKEIEFNCKHYADLPEVEPRRIGAKVAVKKYEEHKERKRNVKDAQKSLRDAHISEVVKSFLEKEKPAVPKDRPKRSTLTLKKPPEA